MAIQEENRSRVIWKREMVPPARVIHTPVMVREVISALQPRRGRFFLDATGGTGGHALAIAEEMRDDAILVCNDWDPSPLEIAKERLQGLGKTIIFTSRNFADLERISEDTGIKAFDGILADLGICLLHVEDPVRGFSFRHEGPLDMRMSPSAPFTAWEIVNRLDEVELARIIRFYGEEPSARRIARAIVEARKAEPINTTVQLARIVEKAVGRRRGKIHPATKTFQALRIAVNDELRNLENFLSKVLDFLSSGGRLVVISFHSLEDRIVKRAFKDWEKRGLGKNLYKKVVCPGEEEVKRNPHARSAKLRAFEKGEER